MLTVLLAKFGEQRVKLNGGVPLRADQFADGSDCSRRVMSCKEEL
jgi:hypothetical protein